MNKLIAVIALTTLAGCATKVSELTEQSTRLAGTSRNDVVQFSDCVKRGWVDVATVQELKLPNEGVQLVATGQFGPVAVVDILPAGPGTSFKYYQEGLDLQYQPRIMRAAITTCKG